MGTSTDLINATQIVSVIASSTTGYLANFSPLVLLMGGILLAFGVMFILVDFLRPEKPINIPDFDFAKADDLKRFYSKRGRSPGAQYDISNPGFDDSIEW